MSRRESANREYLNILRTADNTGDGMKAKRFLAQQDLFFLLVYVLHRQDINHDWLFDRCREVQKKPNGCLDLWARDHRKSTIITFGLTIQDILNNPEVTVGIFSFIRSIAKSFLRQIKFELETNEELKELFPDILYPDPQKDSPKWSEDEGIIVIRSTNPKEATVEAFGLVDGMPTGKHYQVRVYDDIITEKSVTTPDMIHKVTNAWGLSLSLGTETGVIRGIGTRYHFADTYQEIMDRGSLTPRIYPGTEDGTETGKSVLIAPEILRQKRVDMGEYIFACQILQKPITDGRQELKEEWLKYWNVVTWNNLNIYIICDPAGEKNRNNDNTVFTVWGLGPDENYYVIEWVRDKLNLTERADTLFRLQQKYRPLKVIYEKYGMQSDIEHYEDRMERENYRFSITPIGGNVQKEDRIRKLIPLFEQGRVYIPNVCEKIDYKGDKADLSAIFVKEEYKLFPYLKHDDMLDCMARIVEVNPVFPLIISKPIRPGYEPLDCGIGY